MRRIDGRERAMRFSHEVVTFDFAGIPMVGSLATGYAIGLTEAGAAVCARMLHEDVSQDEVRAVDPALLEHLAKGGFFENATVGRDDVSHERPNAPSGLRVSSAYLHVTQRCNLDCVGCYSLDAQRNALADAPLADILHAVDQLAAAGVSQLIISGGEPFLRADLPDIVRHAKLERGIATVNVLSNGTCLVSEALDRLAPFVDCVSISFDGHSADAPAYIRGEQRFDQLVEAVAAVRAVGIEAHILPTVHAKNIGELAEYVRLSKELDATLSFSLLSCESSDGPLGALLPGDEELRQLGRSLLTLNDGRPIPTLDAPVGMNLTVKRRCEAGSKSLSVAADGTIYPCHMLQQPQLAMGNAFTGTVADALRSDVASLFQALDAANFEGCEACRYLHLCGGGCRARSLFSSGTLESKDSYCTMTSAFYDALGQTLNARLSQRR